jgi:hypothetical protein
LLREVTPSAAAPGGRARRGRVLKLDPTHRVLVLPGLAAGSLSFRRVLSLLSYRGVHAMALEKIMNRDIFHAFEHLM